MSLHWLEAACAAPEVAFADAARARQGMLTKPPGSLGALEEVAIQLAGLQRTAKPAVDRVWISVFAGDHGVAAEGVSVHSSSAAVGDGGDVRSLSRTRRAKENSRTNSWARTKP